MEVMVHTMAIKEKKQKEIKHVKELKNKEKCYIAGMF